MERGLAGEILARIERRGCALRAGKLVRVSRDLGERHYAEHREKPFFGELVEFITSAPTLARVVGVDPTPAQLATARRMQAEFGLEFPLIEAVAEDVPLPDASFDLVHS